MGSETASPDSSMMQIAIEEALRGVSTGEGGPFGAVIAQNGNIISRGHNRVLQTNDPTAHAEVVAIRDACSKLGRFSLHDCVIYSTCEPCPMCFSAIHWAKLPRCYFSATADDAAQVGFDDRFLYDKIKGKDVDTKCHIVRMACEHSEQPFTEYRKALERNESGRY